MDLLDNVLPIPLYRSMCSKWSGLAVLKRRKKGYKASRENVFFSLNCIAKLYQLQPSWRRRACLGHGPRTVGYARYLKLLVIYLLIAGILCFIGIYCSEYRKKELTVTPHAMRFLPAQNYGSVRYDMIVVLGYGSRMAGNHADVKARPVRGNFIESAVCLRNVYRAQAEPPQ